MTTPFGSSYVSSTQIDSDQKPISPSTSQPETNTVISIEAAEKSENVPLEKAETAAPPLPEVRARLKQIEIDIPELTKEYSFLYIADTHLQMCDVNEPEDVYQYAAEAAGNAISVCTWQS